MTSAQATMYPPSRAASFQRMLDLEKKYKLERFQTSPQHSTASSPTAESFNGYPQYQARTDDSLSHCQNDLMLKAVRRNATLPSLSITIPPPRNADIEVRAAREMEPEHEDEYDPDLENVEPEPLQKSVKFLAPDSDSDNESVQSSICQSPSWEGYGQKKKEKKKEAERKRKEREQAEREARAARKKPFSRLSKAPPPVSMRHPPTLMERSNSAPILDSHHSFAPSRSHQLAAVQDETELEYQMSDSRSVTPDPKDFLGQGNNRFPPGAKLQQERKAAAQNSMDPRFPPSFREGHSNGYAQDPRQPMHKSYSAGPRMDMSYLGQAASTRQGFKTPRESCPPSASRTPQLRHMAQDRGLPRSNSLLQSTSKTFRDREVTNQQISNLYSHTSHSQESLHTTDLLADRSRPDDGYVRRQRDQNAERAMADLEDEHLAYSMGLSAYSSTRMSSQQPSRPHDAKPAATKSSSRNKTPSAVTSRHGDQPAGENGDYFTLAGPPYSQLPQDGPAPVEDQAYMKGKAGKKVETPPAASVTPQELAHTASSGSSTTESGGNGVIRSLRGAAIAALHRSPAPPPSTAVKIPPYLALRLRMSSSNSAPAPAPPTVQTATVPVSANIPRPPKASHGGYANPNAQNPQPDSRVSEGSSSSSNYDDVSPLPSPATTPDTSRPQSAKGVHPTVAEVSRGVVENLAVQDDQRTLRQSSEASSGSDSPSVTPRPRVGTGEDMTDEDRWSRTAMPMDIDFDTPEDSHWKGSAEEGDDSPTFGESDEAVTKPLKSHDSARTRLNSGISLSAVGPRPSPPPKDEPIIPHRSKARDGQSKTSPTRIQFQEADKEPEKEPEPESRHTLKLQRRLRKQKPEIEHKPVKELSDDAISIRSVSTISKSTNVTASTSASMLSARFMSPIGGFVPSYGFASHPFFVDISELNKSGSETVKVTLPLKVTRTEILLQGSAPPRGRVLGPDATTGPRPEPGSKETRVLPAPEATKPAAKSTSTPPPATMTEAKVGPSSKPATPVSILKPTSQPQPMPEDSQNQTPASKPPVLSAIPKHLQAQTSVRGAVATTQEARKAPIAKMFVECCGCHFYHDMPSKLYECMAKPDAVVEDRNLGISGAITTMVKCPWCQHNMTTKCCSGYAAVVYVKEKLH